MSPGVVLGYFPNLPNLPLDAKGEATTICKKKKQGQSCPKVAQQ